MPMHRNASRVGAGSSCVVFMFCIFGATSPYWIWTYGWGGAAYWGATYSATLGSGVEFAGYTSTSVPCGGWYYCYTNSMTSWTDNLDSACDASACGAATGTGTPGTCPDGSAATESNCLTSMMEKYGMCANGKYTEPAEQVQVWWLTVAACATSGFATICAIMGRDGGAMSNVAGALTLVTAALACAAFSVYTAWEYPSAVRNGHAGLIMTSGDRGCAYAQSESTDSFGYGPAYIMMVMAFIVSLLNAVAFFLSGPQESEDATADGAYGGGGNGKYI